ncbi:gustatory receptor [Homalodisca vitripennis]|nr:gustatory receptor [Homalodisca vitripennis]
MLWASKWYEMYTMDSFFHHKHKMFKGIALARTIANTTMILALFFSYNRKQMRFVRIHYDLDMIDKNLKLTTKSTNATIKMVATCIVYGAALPSISTLLWMIHFYNINISFQEQKFSIIHYLCIGSMAWAQGVLLVHFNHITQGIAARFLNVTYKIEQVVVGNDSTSLMPYQILVSGSSLERHTSSGTIKALIRDYWLLCGTVREANAFYGDQLLAVVLTSFFCILISLSAFVIYFTEDNMTGTIVAGIWSFSYIAFLLLMAYLNTNVTESADEMVRTVCRLINMEINDEIRDQLDEFLLQLSNHKVELSACGFFNINYQTLTSGIQQNQSVTYIWRIQLIDRPADCDIERQSVVTGHIVTVTTCRSNYPTCETVTTDFLLPTNSIKCPTAQMFVLCPVN